MPADCRYHFIYRGARRCAFGFYGHSDLLIIFFASRFFISLIHKIGGFDASDWNNWMPTLWMKVIAWCLKNFSTMHPTLTSKLDYYFFPFFFRPNSLLLAHYYRLKLKYPFQLHRILCWKDNEINIDVESVSFCKESNENKSLKYSIKFNYNWTF